MKTLGLRATGGDMAPPLHEGAQNATDGTKAMQPSGMPRARPGQAVLPRAHEGRGRGAAGGGKERL